MTTVSRPPSTETAQTTSAGVDARQLLTGVLISGIPVGLVIGLRDGSTHAIEATTGLTAAATLFAGAITRLVVAARAGAMSAR